MALTQQQKLENKKEFALRNAAYSARSTAYRTFINSGLAEVDESIELKEVNATEFELKTLIEQCNAEQQEIQQQIEALLAKKNAVEENFNPKFAKNKERRVIAWDAFNAKKSKVQKDADKLFPDKKCNGAADWIPPAGYLEQFAIDNKVSLAKKTAKIEKTLRSRK